MPLGMLFMIENAARPDRTPLVPKISPARLVSLTLRPIGEAVAAADVVATQSPKTVRSGP